MFGHACVSLHTLLITVLQCSERWKAGTKVGRAQVVHKIYAFFLILGSGGPTLLSDYVTFVNVSKHYAFGTGRVAHIHSIEKQTRSNRFVYNLLKPAESCHIQFYWLKIFAVASYQ